jgi:hypothetical protein
MIAYVETAPDLDECAPETIREKLGRFVQQEKASGRLTLTPPEPTPFWWRLRHFFDWATLGLLIAGGVLTLPLTILPLLLLAGKLRALETTDPEVAPRPDRQWAFHLSALEDHDVTNQFSAMGSLKPGVFRRLILTFILWIVNLTTHLIYTKGRLARVHTIHFARWVYLDNRTRLFFASNYDGSLDSYMDDFINKVAFGLNAVFSNGVGYPRTDWLVLKGAKNEQLFKNFIRRHELPTEVWYDGRAGLTTFDLERNSRIRQGLEAAAMSDQEAGEWLALF